MLLEWLSDMEMKLKYAGALPEDPDQLNSQLSQLQNLQRQFQQQQSSLDAALQLGNEILTKCHPDAKQPMRHWLTILQSRWDEVTGYFLLYLYLYILLEFFSRFHRGLSSEKNVSKIRSNYSKTKTV